VRQGLRRVLMRTQLSYRNYEIVPMTTCPRDLGGPLFAAGQLAFEFVKRTLRKNSPFEQFAS
jgi:hypothetical protein